MNDDTIKLLFLLLFIYNRNRGFVNIFEISPLTTVISISHD